MKLVFITVLLAALCGLAMCDDSMEEMKKIGDACLEENKATKKNFEDLAAGNMKPEEVPDNMKCTVKCFMQKHGFLDEAGNAFNADAFKAKMSGKADIENLEKALASCKDLKGDNGCDTAFKIMTCMWKNRAMKE